jgi:hypothetical protein
LVYLKSTEKTFELIQDSIREIAYYNTKNCGVHNLRVCGKTASEAVFLPPES